MDFQQQDTSYDSDELRENSEESEENSEELENDEEESQENVEESEEESEQDSEDDSSESEHPQTNKRKLESTSDPNKKLKTENGHSERRIKNDLRKPLTADELRQMRETENLYNSSLFRLQIEELLKGVKIKQKYKNLFDTWFNDFKNFIKSLPEYEDVKLSELTDAKVKFFKSVFNIHQISLKTDHDVTLKFIKPQACDIFGLHKINASIGPKASININIGMPKSSFLEKDYLNNRYFVKRDYYLSYIYLRLKKTDLCSDLSYFQNSVLTVIPKSCEKIQINLYVTPAESCFKLSRFVPNVNNIRENLFEEFRDVDTTQLRELGTPFYNSVMLSDLTLKENYEHVENSLVDLENVKDGIKLLSVWLRQRNLHLECGFSENLLAQTILYLVLKKKLNKHMSSYQVIRNFWVFVSTTNWHEDPISICEDVKPDRLSAFREAFDVVFLDTSGCYNLAAFLQLNVYMKVRSEAEFAVKYLDNVNFDSFGALFMTQMSPELQYDVLLMFKDSKSFKNIYKNISATEKCKYMGSYQTLITKHTLFLLSKGLNKRATHIVPLSLEQNKNNSLFTQITFGLTLNRVEALKIVEKGPPSNHPEARDFRQFWGKLSECRRFADGSICEAVHFPTETIQEKRNIYKKILEFIATEKLKVEQHMVIANVFENMLVLKNYITPFPTGTSEEASLKIIEIFDKLAKKLREFNLPLDITTVQGVSEVFSYTALFPPIPTNYRWGGKLTVCKGNNIILNERTKFGTVPKYVEPVECVLQLGMNSKWPNNLEALQHLKVGFYLELSKKLQEDFQIISNATREYLEVLYNGLVFRFRLYNPREISALKKFTTPNGITSFKDTEESVELEKNLLILPRIVSALHGIHSNNPTFGPSTSLIKRWLRAQMLDEYHIPDIVVDLLNASLYLACAPYTSPNLPQVAFLRFIKHIGDFDWNSQAIIVNFNDELTTEALGQFESNFQENRHNYPVLCIVTPYDEGKSLFSKKCSKEVARRLSLLAKGTYDIVHNGVISQNLSTIQDLFIPNLEGYNALIHLKPLLNPRRHQQIDVVKADDSKMVIEAYNEEENSKIPIVGFNPVESYIKQLRESYGNLALFFYDSYGGNVIGVLWLPTAFEHKQFKTTHVEGQKLVKNNLVLNKAAILEDFSILGNGLVKTVQECTT